MRLKRSDLPLAIAAHWSWSGTAAIPTNSPYEFDQLPGPPTIIKEEWLGDDITIRDSGRIALGIPGLWFVSASASFAASTGTGPRQVNIKRNVSDVITAAVGGTTGASNSSGATCSAFIRADAGDFVDLGVFQNIGVNLNLISAKLWVAYMGRTQAA